MKLISLLFCFSFLAACTAGQSKVSGKKFLKNHHSGKTFGKSTGYFKIDLSSVDIGDDQVRLVANVTPLKAMTDVEFKWTLPDHIALISGEKQGSMDLSDRNQSQVEMVLDKNSIKKGEQIFFFAYKMQNGERHGATTSYVFEEADDKKEVKASRQKIKTKKHPKYFE